MKNALLFLVGMATAAGLTFFVVSKRHASDLATVKRTMEDSFDQEKNRLEKEWKSRQRPAPLAPVVGEPAAPEVLYAGLTPEETLERLLTLKPSATDARGQTMRKIIYHLESLAEAGPASLDPIKTFIKKNQDIDYLIDREEMMQALATNNAASAPATATATNNSQDSAAERAARRARENLFASMGGRGGRNRVRLDFSEPPSLRLGLVDVLRQIGGEASESILSEMLQTSARGVEVAYVARTLQELAPGKYRDQAVASAKDLLLNPVAGNGSNRLDENSKMYLYEVLNMFQDTSFVATAQSLLVTPDGHLDGSTLNFITSSLKDQAMPMIYNAYKDPRITNQMERAALMSVAMTHVGVNSQANQMVKEIISDEQLPQQMRAMAVFGLVGGGGFGGNRGEAPQDPAVLRGRLQFVESLRGSVQDEFMVASIDRTSQNLQNLIDGKPIENNFRGRGRGGAAPVEGAPR